MRRKSYRILRPGCPGTTGTLLPQSRSKPLPPADHRSPTALVIDLTKEVFHACRKGTKVELVPEDKVRAKRGCTRVFVPADNEEVIRFFANLGKWFLHFSEPDAITQAILTKKSRNLDADCHTAVIYRRGVRVREIEACSAESLFDYNLNDLRVDESRNVDDYQCRNAATKAMAKGSPEVLAV